MGKLEDKKLNQFIEENDKVIQKNLDYFKTLPIKDLRKIAKEHNLHYHIKLTSKKSIIAAFKHIYEQQFYDSLLFYFGQKLDKDNKYYL